MTFMQGEIRQIGIEITNVAGQDFVIDAAEYEILDTEGNQIERGYPTINGHKILTLFNASQKGSFYVFFKYHIGPEILKAKIFVEVV